MWPVSPHCQSSLYVLCMSVAFMAVPIVELCNRVLHFQYPHDAFPHIFMAALSNKAGHYIFILCLLLSFFFFFFSSPNLSRCRLDVYHTSTIPYIGCLPAS